MKEPCCVGPEETLDTVARKLKDDNLGCLPVCEDKHVLGMITDRDILTRCVAKNRNASKMTAREAMSTEIYCRSEEDSMEHVVAIMANSQVRRLPVLDGNKQLIGIVSLTDLTGDASERSRVEVVFYKELNSHGRTHHSELTRVSIAPGHTKEEAVAAAIRQVEREKQSAWKSFADRYDVIDIHTDDRGKVVEEVERASEKDDRIRRRAYDLWEQRGEPPSRPGEALGPSPPGD